MGAPVTGDASLPGPVEEPHGSLEALLHEWLELTGRLQDALAREEPDPRTIEGVLEQRRRLQAAIAGQIASGAPIAEELRKLAQECVAADDEVLRKARERLADWLGKLDELRQRRVATGGYRRAVVDAAQAGTGFVDRRV